METTSPDAARFWDNVDKSGGPGACWPWRFATSDEGYGIVKFKHKTRQAHRVAYELTFGPLDRSQVVRHLVCDNPPCCNPSHLKPGTHADNVADRVAKGRSAVGTRNGRSKLDPEKVREIWGLLKLGETPRQIAKKYFVDHSTIRFIRDRVNWRSVTDDLPPNSPQSPHEALFATQSI